MNGQVAYVSFVRPINWETASPLLNTCNQIVNSGVRELYLLLSSPGGQVDPGFAMFNQLIGLPVELITHNIGSIDSMANILFLSGSRRLACANSTFLFHGIHWGFPSPTEVIRPKLMEIVSSLRAAENRMRDVIVSKSSLSNEEVDGFFSEGATKDAEFALSKGIINAIEDVHIPTGVQVIQV
ncbi:MAG: ATP-dependent Clp protease proteolytic subunit [Desulfobaccales bacterium]